MWFVADLSMGVTVAEAGWLDLCDNKRHSYSWYRTTIRTAIYSPTLMARVWQHEAQRQMTWFVTGTTHPHYSQVASAHTQYGIHRILFAQDAAEFFLDVLPQVPKAPQLRRPSKHLVRCYSAGTVGVLDEHVRPLPSPRFLPSLHHPLERLRLGCLLYTSPSPRDLSTSRMPSSA